MSHFIRLLHDKDKEIDLHEVCSKIRGGDKENRHFEVSPKSFEQVPGAPFAYWVSEGIRETFRRFPAFEGGERTVRQGLATTDDFRFVRGWWEVKEDIRWFGLTKGGSFSRFYSDIPVVVNWYSAGKEIRAAICKRYPYLNGNADFVAKNPQYYFRPGITWPLRGVRFSAQVVPSGCVFSVAGKMAFAPMQDLGAWISIFNSKAFDYLVRLFAGKVGGVQYEAGLIGGIPAVDIDSKYLEKLTELARLGISYKRVLSSTEEKSHTFLLPSVLLKRLGKYDRSAIEAELGEIERKIDDIVFHLYGFTDEDRAAASEYVAADIVIDEDANDVSEPNEDIDLSSEDHLLSWAIGISFARFDWRLATGEREAPPESEPFDPLPAKSPGMLPDDVEPFHHHAGILVDEEGHQHDLPRLVEQVLETVDAPVNQDIRRWLRKDFFPFHLQQYSKSRRKAPIYWPLSTASGSYTLWLYYPELTNQTLFTAVNDFVEPKLNSVRDDLNGLRTKGGGRSKQEEKELEKLEDLEQELADLRDTLLEIAPGYRPNQDDGVQITAAPLWSLFRHKPWQKVLKDTWKQLEKGDYDWAHLALNYWPDRVLRKCHEDRSLAIAHDVEDEFWEEVEVPLIRRGKDTGETKLEWQPKGLSEAQLQTLINQVRQERSL